MNGMISGATLSRIYLVWCHRVKEYPHDCLLLVACRVPAGSRVRMCTWQAGCNVTGAAGAGGNNTTWVGVEEREHNWNVLLLAPVVVFGVAGNTLVIMAISLEKRLQNVTNYFLMSLAVTDLLVSLIVMPLSIINEITGQWLFGLTLCNLFVTSDVFMCTSSILHLCTISLERYIGIRYPLWTKNKSKRVVLMKIVLVWTIAFAISSPISILGFVDGKNILQNEQCVLDNEHFQTYGSIFAFFIPLVIMIIMYTLTVRMLNKQAKMCSNDKEGQPMMRRSTSRRHWKAGDSQKREHLRFSRSFPISSGSTDEQSQCVNQYKPLTKRNTVPRSQQNAISLRRGIDNRVEYTFRNGSAQDLVNPSPDRSNCCKINLIAKKEPMKLRDLVKKHHVAIKAANILLLKKDSIRKDSNSVQTEQKASKVLGVVFLIFVICWAPFFLVNILTALCKTCTFQPMLITAFVWLGYVSSTLNPIIYTVFNKIFKQTFIKLLCCRYNTLHRGRRHSAITSRTGLMCNSMCGSGNSHSMEESAC
ncbi:5-hydroxytryptamine receptor 2C-like [Haliotis rufescens]|uniref:5-hydroxytryptamine receptor 2C-like n=1 Tax=Haliotis rufescens TaxID=6454 RepID=UPI001EAFED14|nr:5-hydroxytryptamine receptor 2C-like [Haliotis rufescens]XP_046365274.1 5-hydroxytryptamine receptor 2C-like [Haliotis rufescens]